MFWRWRRSTSQQGAREGEGEGHRVRDIEMPESSDSSGHEFVPTMRQRGAPMGGQPGGGSMLRRRTAPSEGEEEGGGEALPMHGSGGYEGLMQNGSGSVELGDGEEGLLPQQQRRQGSGGGAAMEQAAQQAQGGERWGGEPDVDAPSQHQNGVMQPQQQQSQQQQQQRLHAPRRPDKQTSLPKDTCIIVHQAPPPSPAAVVVTAAAAAAAAAQRSPLRHLSPKPSASGQEPDPFPSASSSAQAPRPNKASSGQAWAPPTPPLLPPPPPVNGSLPFLRPPPIFPLPPPPGAAAPPLPSALCPPLPTAPPSPPASAHRADNEAPCPLRPCPPSSSSGMRTESFTSGTGGRLMRPGVGIGAGTMREARYEDLRLIQQIGEGGFGKVYYGHWCGSPVAIKVATPHAEEAERQLQEFQREVTNMSTLPPHGNVLKLQAACMDPEHLALVTEFCSRGSLYNLLHTPGAQRMPPHQLLPLWLGVARGMQHLHACRVLHRDLKSANLLLDDMGSIKIGDFGLSRICSGQAVVQQGMTGGLGTYQWMAPEVLTSQRYSEKADVYSFAMVMWETLTLKLPYEGMTAMQAGLRVATQGLRPDIPASVDPAQAQLIRDCWAPVSDQRPSFTQVVLRLEAMLAELERPRGTLTAAAAASTSDAGSGGPAAEAAARPSQEDKPAPSPSGQQQQQQHQHQHQHRPRPRQQLLFHQHHMVGTLPGQPEDLELQQQELREQGGGAGGGGGGVAGAGVAEDGHGQLRLMVGPPPRPGGRNHLLV